MYWQDDERPVDDVVTDEVVDLVFGMRCRRLPVDHGLALLQGLAQRLPWLPDDERAGVHRIRGARSAAVADAGAGEILLVPRRARLVLRLPRERVDDARALCGANIRVGDEDLTIGDAGIRLLSPLTTLMAHHVIDPDDAGESRFLDVLVDRLGRTGIRAEKIVCGRPARVTTAAGPVRTRSVMIADLAFADALRLQQSGTGDGRVIGCGLFVPCKEIGATARRDR